MAKAQRPEVRESLFDAIADADTPAEIKEKWKDCAKCPRLAKNRKQVVFWDGEPGARIMVIGQWPGKDEDITGIPFQGAAGQLCRDMLTDKGRRIPPKDVIWTNVLGCRVSETDTFQTRFMLNCTDLIESQIKAFKPKLIVGLGRVAMIRLTGIKSVRVEDLDGKTGVYKGTPTIFFKHPAFLNRIQDKKERARAYDNMMENMYALYALYQKIREKEARDADRGTTEGTQGDGSAASSDVC